MKRRLAASAVACLAVVAVTAPTTAVGAAARSTSGTRADAFAIFFRNDPTGDAARALAVRNCGTERWPVKTGTDSLRSQVNTHAHDATIRYLTRRPQPASRPQASRAAPYELRTYRLRTRLIEYVREADGDDHLVLRDSHGRTMIAEIPDPGCVGSISPFAAGIRRARRHMNAAFDVTSSFKHTHRRVTVRGVAFFDFSHGQTGRAANNIELHPVTGLAIG